MLYIPLMVIERDVAAGARRRARGVGPADSWLARPGGLREAREASHPSVFAQRLARRDGQDSTLDAQGGLCAVERTPFFPAALLLAMTPCLPAPSLLSPPRTVLLLDLST